MENERKAKSWAERDRCFRQRYAVIEGKSLKFYDSEAEAQPQDGGIYAVIATITAGIWVAFFARVPAMIVRTGGAGPGARQFDRGCERLRRDPWYREVYLLAQPVRSTIPSNHSNIAKTILVASD